MPSYAIGDIQGCFITLQNLLSQIAFSHDDELILLGDSINRGPRSLEVLRFIIRHQQNIKLILGNHEIFTIALALSSIKDYHRHTIKNILEADDKDELITFLRSCPLLLKKDNHVFVHAGILPCISIAKALDDAAILHDIIMSDDAPIFLQDFYQNTPQAYMPSMPKKEYYHLTLAYLTLMRNCKNKYTMDMTAKSSSPWFTLRDQVDEYIYFGHWAALGCYRYKNYYCLDSGCVWGRKLSALRIEDKHIFQVDYAD